MISQSLLFGNPIISLEGSVAQEDKHPSCAHLGYANTSLKMISVAPSDIFTRSCYQDVHVAKVQAKRFSFHQVPFFLFHPLSALLISSIDKD
jgi:hypothetical protein